MKSSKKEALKLLSKEMKKMLGDSYKDDLGGKIGVKVMADSPEAAVDGLSKAQKILKKKMEESDDDDKSEDMDSKKELLKKMLE